MINHPPSSVLARTLSITFFSIGTLSALVWFFVSLIGVITLFRLNKPVITFDKGAMYMLGVGLGLLLLTITGFIQGVLKKKLSHRAEILFKRGIIVSVMLMLVTPQLAHYLVANSAQQRHYDICKAASYRWFLYSKFYYTQNEMTCNQLLETR